ncbi:MAG: hypothetical protein GXP48_01350 [Acidobacteria bacterium]|nr:hypothetical protein [Acidobacteriota bacterium]
MNRTLKWAVAGLIAVVPFALSAQAGNNTYVGAKKCKMCHHLEYTSWQTTTHAKATDVAKASTQRKFGPECLKCHATNADANMPGVQCEACHGAGSAYKKFPIMKDLAKAKANGLIIPTQETCNQCHTGKGHSKKVEFKTAINNKSAIHKFKHPLGK